MNFSVIGGDIRQISLANRLYNIGHIVKVMGFSDYSTVCEGIKICDTLEDCVGESSFIILPLPISGDDEHISRTDIRLFDLFSLTTKNTTVFGGKISPKLYTMSPYTLIDYYKKEELQIKNAVPTAEGAVAEAIRRTDKTLKDCKILVTGYGRVAKALSVLLKAFNQEIHIAARNEKDLAWIECFGFIPVNINKIERLHEFDVIFNTVPTMILPEERLATLKEKAVIIELASKPYGFDLKYADENNINYVIASSLPGKTAPVSAGNILCDTILNIIRERSSYGFNRS